MKIKPRGRPKGTCGKTVVLTQVEKRTLFRSLGRNSTNFDRARIAAIMSINLGLTASHLSSLKMSDVYDDDGNVRPAIRLRDDHGSKSFREPGLGLRRTLADYRERLSNFRILFEDSPMFQSQRGGHMTPASMARYLTNTFRQAGIANASSRSGKMTWLAEANRRMR